LKTARHPAVVKRLRGWCIILHPSLTSKFIKKIRRHRSSKGRKFHNTLTHRTLNFYAFFVPCIMRTLILILFAFLVAQPLLAQNDAISRRGKKFIYKNDHKLFHTRYDSIRNFSEGRSAVMRKGKWGYIDTAGTVICKPTYEDALDYRSGFGAVQKAETYRWQILDLNGNAVNYASYNEIIYLDSFVCGTEKSYKRYSDVMDVFHHQHSGAKYYHEVVRIISRDSGYVFLYNDNLCNNPDALSAQVIDVHGQQVTPNFTYADSILNKESIIYRCYDHKNAVLTTDFRVSEWYDDIRTDQNGIRIVKDHDKFGAINSRLTEIVPVKNKFVTYSDQYLVVQNVNGSYAADSNGRIIGTPHANIFYLGSGMFRISEGPDLSYAIMNSNGDVLPGNYKSVNEYHCGVALVTDSAHTNFGYVTTEGKLISGWHPRCIDYKEPYTYYDVGGTFLRVFMGIVTVGITEATGVFDGIGGEQTEPEKYITDYGADFKNGYSYYTVRRKSPAPNKHKEELVYYGVIDSTGKIVIPAKYDAVEQQDSFFLVGINSRYGMCTRQGKQVLPIQYSSIRSLGNNFFEVGLNTTSVSEKALYKYQNGKGLFLTPFIYDSFRDGGDSTFIVEDWPEKGYIDYLGKVLVRPKYSQAGPFENGRAKVSFDYTGGEFYIDRKGKKVQ
jgi:hypothetical protein